MVEAALDVSQTEALVEQAVVETGLIDMLVDQMAWQEQAEVVAEQQEDLMLLVLMLGVLEFVSFDGVIRKGEIYMIVHQVYAQIVEGEIKNIIVCDNYEWLS